MNEKISAAEQQRVFDLIWSQMPHMQNRMSSSWWFFLLFPKGPKGYGPKQIMYAITARAGDRINISGADLQGIDLKRPLDPQKDEFEVQNVGWYFDGQKVYEKLVYETALATLSSDGYIKAWADRANGERYGSEIWASASEPLTLEAFFKGDKGQARFKTWGDLNKLDTSPDESINIKTPLGGTHFIAWRLVNFEGEFTSPVGTEHLSGLGYFQRVCLNVPAFPWKWVWSLFADGTLFSTYVPYIGPQLFRKGYKFFKSEWWERRTLSLFPGAFIDFPEATERLMFDTSRITPVLGKGPHPDFEVHSWSKNGDFVKFYAECLGHAPQSLGRSLLGGRLNSYWSYNEYMFRMRQLSGKVGDRLINEETMGPGWGSLEYTWGVGL
ncbi:MAG: hypothetical protein R3293_03760 [Candidatus Promineifilaceae bacterium]|nr:hypothetical protein [Candidatus Promineifilaceae bacterium]